VVVDIADPAARTRRYRVDELLDTAIAHGYDPTRRLITDWIAVGLVDKGVSTGRGRGKGKTYTWSYEQLRMFLTILEKSAEVKRATLFNIPVMTWLIWGDQFVPLRQTRRALEHWAGIYGQVSGARARRTAREVLTQLDHPKATKEDRKRLLELIVNSGYLAKLDREQLLDAATRVFNPDGADRSSVPSDGVTPESYVRILEARITALHQLPDLPDELFQEARISYQSFGPTGELTRAALDPRTQISAPASFVTRFKRATNQSCLDLLTLLGILLNRHDRLPPIDRGQPDPNPATHSRIIDKQPR
jgi:hypothetical protein